MSTGAYDTVQILYSLVETVCCEKLLPLARKLNIGVIGLGNIGFRHLQALMKLNKKANIFLKIYLSKNGAPSDSTQNLEYT